MKLHNALKHFKGILHELYHIDIANENVGLGLEG